MLQVLLKSETTQCLLFIDGHDGQHGEKQYLVIILGLIWMQEIGGGWWKCALRRHAVTEDGIASAHAGGWKQWTSPVYLPDALGEENIRRDMNRLPLHTLPLSPRCMSWMKDGTRTRFIGTCARFVPKRDVAAMDAAGLRSVCLQLCYSHGLGGKPQHIHMWANRAPDVSGSPLQLDLHAQPAQPLRSTDSCSCHGGKWVFLFCPSLFPCWSAFCVGRWGKKNGVAMELAVG